MRAWPSASQRCNLPVPRPGVRQLQGWQPLRRLPVLRLAGMTTKNQTTESHLSPTPRQIRLEAAAVIEKAGWCQGGLTDRRGRVCLLGAMMLAADSLGANRGDMALAWVELDREAGEALPRWNDAPSRTKEEVLDLLHGNSAN